MEAREFELLGEVQETHWIWRGRKKAIETLIENHITPRRNLSIADVGSGCGGNFNLLSKYGTILGLEPSERAIQISRGKFPEINVVKWQFPNEITKTFDLILASEVLEHVPDDREAVEWIYDRLRPGGFILVTVPAHRFLWTQMDDVVQHQRRYSGAQLKNLFHKFTIIRVSYYNFFLFPLKLGLVLYDRLQRLLNPASTKQSFNNLPPRIINNTLAAISIFEGSLLKSISFPVGPSLIFLAQKKQGA